MADVFLSYSSRDRRAAERVEQALSARGIDVFWDQETPPGADWDSWIRSKLANAEVAVVLWSNNSIASPNVRHEAMVARDAGKLLPAMIEMLSPAEFPMGLYLVQGVQLQDWRERKSRGMERLVAEVEARLTSGGGTPVNPASGSANSAAIAAMTTPSRGLLAVAGVVVAAVLAAVGWLAFRPDSTNGQPAGGGELTTAVSASSDGNQSVVPIPAPSSPASTPTMFSNRILGHWHWEGQACADGTDIALEDGNLVFKTLGSPRYVHAIVSDSGLETRTRVLSPESDAGQEYTLRAQFAGADTGPNFTLVLVSGDEKDTWDRC